MIASLRAARSSGEITRLIKELKPSTAKEFTICLSAYGRVRDWRSAIALLDEMRRCGVEPDVYGFSAAIQACEKCRQWERALSLLEEMQQRGIEPNFVSFNAAISACEKGKQWKRALSLLDEMQQRGLRQTVVSFSAAIQACAAAGQPEPALQVFERLEASSVDADSVAFNAVLDALYGQPGRAREIWKIGCSRGYYRDGFERWGSVPALDLHDLSEGAAETAVRWWLEEGVRDKVAAAPDEAPERLELITGWGKSREVAQVTDVRARIEAVLRDMGATMLPTDNPGLLVVDAEPWIGNEEF